MGRFSKMHGLGNDFVVIDARTGPVAMTEARVRAIADRHAGIGCDQLIMIGDAPDADVSMQIFNADGSEVEACGNATVPRAYSFGTVSYTHLTLPTKA